MKSVKADIHKREKDALDGIRQYKEQAQFGERLNSAIQPYQAYLSSKNLAPEAVVKDALNLSYSLTTATPQQKGAILKQIAQQYGADLSVFTQAQDDPNDKTAQYIRQLEEKVNGLAQRQSGFETQSQQQVISAATQQIEQFANATDEAGNAKHPYFENVQDLMRAYLENGQATTLEDAYDKAVWADPDTRQVLLSAQTAEKSAQRQAETSRHAAKAKAATQTNLRKKGEHESKAARPTGSMDDTLNAEYDRIMSQ